MSWLPKKNVVVPVDFSGESAHAVQVARDLVDDVSDLNLVHVLFPLDSVSPGVVWGDVTDEQREKQIRKEFDNLVTEQDLAGVNTVIRSGDPGLGIAEYAAEIGAELIIVPSHGYHGVKRFILGSVAERVIRHAGCSVLVLRRSDAE
jgi:nucleotide-binding universal stress UspA family protein